LPAEQGFAVPIVVVAEQQAAATTLAADTLLMHAFAVVGDVHGFDYVEAFARQWLEMEEGDRQ
jgi:hypothetical protein